MLKLYPELFLNNMKFIIQRVSEASILIDNKNIAMISTGLFILVGFENTDRIDDIDLYINKILNLRIFEDNNNKMNLSIKDINGELLYTSNFTLAANTDKGNRPSFEKCLKYDYAEKYYNYLVHSTFEKYPHVKSGVFGSDMTCEIKNNGPVTIIL